MEQSNSSSSNWNGSNKTLIIKFILHSLNILSWLSGCLILKRLNLKQISPLKLSNTPSVKIIQIECSIFFQSKQQKFVMFLVKLIHVQGNADNRDPAKIIKVNLLDVEKTFIINIESYLGDTFNMYTLLVTRLP